MRGLLLDIGGVLMTNGWDHHLRQQTAEQFQFDFEEVSKRHALFFDSFERGNISFDLYLEHVIFFKERNFSKEELKQFIFHSVKPAEEMLEGCQALKDQPNLRIGVLSNEGRELAEDRFVKFPMDFVNTFIVSSFVHLRKPDPAIYHLALDLLQLPAHQVLYVDDRLPFIEIAETLGLKGIPHTSASTTLSLIKKFIEL